MNSFTEDKLCSLPGASLMLVVALVSIQPVAAGGGYTHGCALTTAGGIKCWGDNTYGQLGDGTATRHLTPVDVSGLSSGVAQISAGQHHTCALTTSGGVKCWGFNGTGALGDGTFIDRVTPVDVSGLTSGVTQISAGALHTCAVTSSGGAKCWGYGGYGQLGDGVLAYQTTPVDVSGLTSGVAQISAGDLHTCAVTTSGGAKCWGDNAVGKLGDGTALQRNTPVDVSGLTSGVAQISAGQDHTCALTNSGGVECWGNNGTGELGNGTTTDSITPVSVSGLTGGVTQISAGGAFNCAVTSGGGVKCWGENRFYGQLGDGSYTFRTVPVDVSGLPNGITQISSGQNHTCALTTGGGEKCWGSNVDGELGDATTTTRNTPVDVSGLTTGVAALPDASGLSIHYTFSGFLEPVRNPPLVNTGKAGRTFPVKFQLLDAANSYASSLAAVKSIAYSATSCSAFTGDLTNALNTSATGGTVLRYDSAANQYLYNWATPAAGCYTLFLTLNSSQVFLAYFNLN